MSPHTALASKWPRNHGWLSPTLTIQLGKFKHHVWNRLKPSVPRLGIRKQPPQDTLSTLLIHYHEQRHHKTTLGSSQWILNLNKSHPTDLLPMAPLPFWPTSFLCQETSGLPFFSLMTQPSSVGRAHTAAVAPIIQKCTRLSLHQWQLYTHQLLGFTVLKCEIGTLGCPNNKYCMIQLPWQIHMAGASQEKHIIGESSTKKDLARSYYHRVRWRKAE